MLELVLTLAACAIGGALLSRFSKAAAKRRAGRFESGKATVVLVRFKMLDHEPNGERSMLTFSKLGLEARDGELRRGSAQPAAFGDFSEFWSGVLKDTAEGLLEEREVGGLIRFTRRVPGDRNRWVVCELNPQDWAIVKQCVPAHDA